MTQESHADGGHVVPMSREAVLRDARRLLHGRFAATLAAVALVMLVLGYAAALAGGLASAYLALRLGPVGAVLALAATFPLLVAATALPLGYLALATRRQLDPDAPEPTMGAVLSRALPLVVVLGVPLLLIAVLFAADAVLYVGTGRVVLTVLLLPVAVLVACALTVRLMLIGLPFVAVDGAGARSAWRQAWRRTRGKGPALLVMALVLLAPLALLAAGLVYLGLGIQLASALGFALGYPLLAVVGAILHRQATHRPHFAATPGMLVEARDLRQWFPIRGGVISRTRAHVRAVDGVTLRIPRGRTVGLVGESGCGKTTVGRTLLRLVAPTGGSILYDGQDITYLEGAELRGLRARMQIVFQDPMSSLNPRMTVRQILREPLRFTAKVPREDIDRRVEEALERVGLKPNHADRYPHEFSGGQRQRIGIARALATSPEFIVLDEPTSALDVSVQAQVLNLLRRLQKELGLTYLFISHDLSVIRHMCDEVAIMYLGQIVEQGPVDEIFRNPQHPYTQALLSAVPLPDPDRKPNRILLTGDVPSPVNPPAACRFHPRCPRAQPICAQVPPPLEEKRPFQLAACHFPGPQENWPVTQTKEVKLTDSYGSS